jgi:hypothetical protein
MRLWLLPLLLLALSAASAAQAPARFDPGPYQAADGAITLSPNGNEVEPYFATKALVVANDAGLDARDAAMKWIAWMLRRQQPDGRIDRWCRNSKPGSDWKRCGDADADDAMLALWSQLLYRYGTDQGLPLEWKQSSDKALAYLETLRNRHGTYYISHRKHTALFMDNVEIYSAFKEIGKQSSRWDLNEAASMHAQSQQLGDAIAHVFWDEGAGRYRPSTQKTRPGFYPDAVAQTYSWLEGMPTPQDPHENWNAWKQQYGRGWLLETYDPHPWGLVALTAVKLDDLATAGCWLAQSAPHRNGAGWNVLEEATFQAVQAKTAANNCGGLVLGE